MFAVLLLYVGFIAVSTVGGLVIARAGSHTARVGTSAAGVLACVFAAAVATVVITSSDLLASP